MLSYLTALGSTFGSAEYTPSMFLASSIASAPISAARSTAAVSVEKNGQPVPQPNMTTLPDLRYSIALSVLYLSPTPWISTAVSTFASPPDWRRTSANARQFIAVASIPIRSAETRSTWPAPSLTPRQKLPPPTTMPTSTPIWVHLLTVSQTFDMKSKSKPVFLSPASASPLILISILL